MATRAEAFEITPEFVTAIRKCLKEVVTQSEIMTRANCPRKWFYRYVLRLKHRGSFNWHFLYGDLMHRMLATLYGERLHGTTQEEKPIKIPAMEFPEDVLPTQADRDEAEILQGIAQTTFENYRIYYKDLDSNMWVESVEQVYEVNYRGVKLAGKMDLVAHPHRQDGVFVYDYKTTGSLNQSMLDAWSFRFQFLFYSWLWWRATGNRPDGNYVNGIMKTLLRPKQIDRKTKEMESPREYLARVSYDMQVNREKYFYRTRLPLARGMLERFEKEILDPHISSLVLLTNATQWKKKPLPRIIQSTAMAMNTDECHKYNSFCPYLALCKDGPMMLPEYIRTEQKHEELI